MPILTPKTDIQKMHDMTIDQEGNRYFLSVSMRVNDAALLCVSSIGPVTAKQLTLTERELSHLCNGGKLEMKGFTLHGITRPQMDGVSHGWEFKVSPPSYVQVWAMKRMDFETALYIPEDPEEQGMSVPQWFDVEMADNQVCIGISSTDGYQDGDLMYTIRGHLPIPIPLSALNQWVPLDLDAGFEVVPAERVRLNYKRRS